MLWTNCGCFFMCKQVINQDVESSDAFLSAAESTETICLRSYSCSQTGHTVGTRLDNIISGSLISSDPK